jgi:hypothetical protein
MDEKMPRSLIPIEAFAIGGIVLLEALAIARGLDGVALSVAVACIAGIAGFEFRGLGKKLK